VPLEYTRKITNPRGSRKEEYYVYFGNASRLSASISLVALFAAPCVKRIIDVHAVQQVPKPLDVSQDFFFPWRRLVLYRTFSIFNVAYLHK